MDPWKRQQTGSWCSACIYPDSVLLYLPRKHKDAQRSLEQTVQGLFLNHSIVPSVSPHSAQRGRISHPFISAHNPCCSGCPGVSAASSLSATQETWASSLGPEDPLEEGTATHSGIPALENPMDRGAWRGFRPGVTESQTQLTN